MVDSIFSSYYTHYTSIDVLNLILKNKSIRFKRLDLVDDISETKILELEDISRLVYVSCWIEAKADDDNLALWAMYGNNMHGVKITLPFFPFIVIMDNNEYFIRDVPKRKTCEVKGFKIIKKNGIQFNPNVFSLAEDEFWNYFCKIEHYDNFDKEKEKVIHSVHNDETAWYSLEKVGRSKHKDWSFLNEYRYFLLYGAQHINYEMLKGTRSGELSEKINALNTEEFIDIPLHEKAINEMMVTSGPKCTESEIDIIHHIIEKYNSNVKYECSKWNKMIRE